MKYAQYFIVNFVVFRSEVELQSFYSAILIPSLKYCYFKYGCKSTFLLPDFNYSGYKTRSKIPWSYGSSNEVFSNFHNVCLFLPPSLPSFFPPILPSYLISFLPLFLLPLSYLSSFLLFSFFCISYSHSNNKTYVYVLCTSFCTWYISVENIYFGGGGVCVRETQAHKHSDSRAMEGTVSCLLRSP